LRRVHNIYLGVWISYTTTITATTTTVNTIITTVKDGGA